MSKTKKKMTMIKLLRGKDILHENFTKKNTFFCAISYSVHKMKIQLTLLNHDVEQKFASGYVSHLEYNSQASTFAAKP
jgi:hypothetical protein